MGEGDAHFHPIEIFQSHCCYTQVMQGRVRRLRCLYHTIRPLNVGIEEIPVLIDGILVPIVRG